MRLLLTTLQMLGMPVVMINTVAESGLTNLGPYSLCFLSTGMCAINAGPNDKRYLAHSRRTTRPTLLRSYSPGCPGQGWLCEVPSSR